MAGTIVIVAALVDLMVSQIGCGCNISGFIAVTEVTAVVKLQ